MAKWGDEELEDETAAVAAVPEPDDLKTVVEFKTNEKGEKIKVTRKVREFKTVRRVNKRVEDRRKKWRKFGKCANAVGLEAGISGIAEPVFLILGDDARRQKEVEEKLKREQNKISEMYRSIVSEVAAGQAPGSSAGGSALWRPRFRDATLPTASNPGGAGPQGAASKAGIYVPVHLRNRPGGPGAGSQMGGIEDTATLRVTNLSEETSENDLDTMFRPFGPIQRIFLAKDKETFRSKGFAFVNYLSRRDAQAAMDALNGKGWDYLILNIEWADNKKPM